MSLKYKFKELKTYLSTDTFEGNSKNYRTIFEKLETTYIYCELSFFNKKVEEEDWTAKIALKCFKIGENASREELCHLTIDQCIPKEDDLVFVRHSWGTPQAGTFWEKGAYEWEAYLDEVLLGQKPFYVEAVGLIKTGSSPKLYNPYFSIESVKLYEGGYEGVPNDNRIYLTHFKRNETRYIFAEVNLISNVQHDWRGELFFNFYGSTGRLKGSIPYPITISNPPKTEYSLTLESGWGASEMATWAEGACVLELVFLDQLLATIPFIVRQQSKVGIPPMYGGSKAFLFSPRRKRIQRYQKRSFTNLITQLRAYFKENQE